MASHEYYEESAASDTSLGRFLPGSKLPIYQMGYAKQCKDEPDDPCSARLLVAKHMVGIEGHSCLDISKPNLYFLVH